MMEIEPENIDDDYDGGVVGCPSDYDLESKFKSMENCYEYGGKGCEYCWNREMSDEEENKMGKEFSLEEFFKKGSKICINCETEEQAKEYCIAMDKLEKRWNSEISYSDRTNWNVYEDNTCYVGIGAYCHKNSAIKDGFTVFKWEDVKDKFFVPVVEIDENEKTFTKSDLENGMVVEYRNGKKRIVVNDRLLGMDSRSTFESYNDNLTHHCNSEYDLCAVYKGENIFSLEKTLKYGYGLEEIWRRKDDPVKFTVKEAEEKLKELLGEEVKIN